MCSLDLIQYEIIFFQTMPEYSAIIKTPMDLSVVRRKLQLKQSPSYKKPDDFVADIRLMFKNCAKFHKVRYDFLGGLCLLLVLNFTLRNLFLG